MSLENENIVINGKVYNKNDKYITEDFITKERIHVLDQLSHRYIYDIEVVRKSSSKVNVNDSSTITSYRKVSGNTLTNLENDSDNMLMFHSLFMGLVHIFNTPQMIKGIIDKLNLIKGENNPDIYYAKEEIQFLDKPQPYRKFNFTYDKQSIEDIIGRKLKPSEKLQADIEELSTNILKRNIEMGVESLTFKEFEGHRYTFGLELETCVGRFLDGEVRHLNLKAVHDGSLREADGSNPIGGEYVTGVLIGDAGLGQLHEICRVLQTKCQVDKRCGVHVHIGSLNWNKEEIVYSYILAEAIEEELFTTLPKSRRNNSYCRTLNVIIGDRVKELNNVKNTSEYEILINEFFDKIFMNVSGLSKVDYRSYNKNTNHPKGSKCGFDKSSQRYSWLNYVTMMFDTKGIPNSHTLEFRPMSGTLNYIKIKNWLKICIAFCSFVENHKSLIRNSKNVPITLETIINKVYPRTGARLNLYIEDRKKTFKTADETIDYKTDKNINKKSMKEVVCVL